MAAGDTKFLVTRLHPQVTVRYGAEQCTAMVATYLDPTYEIGVENLSRPADYQWVTDGLNTVIPATVHLTEIDGAFTWFTDCGTPV